MNQPKTTSDEDSAGSRPVRVIATRPRHADAVAAVVRKAHAVGPDEPCPSCFTPGAVLEQIRRFPAGQLVAVTGVGMDERVVGAATLMRTDHPPTADPRPWLAMIGDLGLSNHDPEGAWLYGVEIAVDPGCQGRGVGSALYARRFALVRELGVRGLYAGGLLKGYHRFRDRLTPREYAERVRRGELEDPTVTMQIHRGFRTGAILEGYDEDELSADCAILIVWEPDVGREVAARGRGAHQERSPRRMVSGG